MHSLNLQAFEILDSEIKEIGGKPKVLEALWDQDMSEGWFLCLYVYVETGFFLNKKITRRPLGQFLSEREIIALSIEVSMEMISILAKELGKKAIEKYNLEFYFPSQDKPDSNCPKWTDQHLAINCADCNKLVLPSKSPYLPKDICYNCHLIRDRNEALINNELIQEGIVLYLSNGIEAKNLGFWGSYDYLILSKFDIPSITNSEKASSMQVFVLKYDELGKLKKDIEQELNLKLKHYSKPEIDEKERKSRKLYKIKEYQGNTYELDIGKKKDHWFILESIKSLDFLDQAINENFNLNVCFVKGLRYREDVILRFLHYLKKGESNLDELELHYKKLLSKEQIIEVIERLKDYNCLTFDGFEIKTTELGKNIV